MGRPEVPIDPHGGPAAEFGLALRARRPPGLTYRKMAGVARYTAPALSQAASGKRVPNWAITEAYLRAVGVAGEELDQWRTRWEAARDAAAAYKRDSHASRAAGAEVVAATVRATTAEVASLAAAALPAVSPPAGPTAPALPDPKAMHSIAELVQVLVLLRERSGLTYREISDRARTLFLPRLDQPTVPGLAASSIRDTLAGGRAPSPGFVMLFMLACGVRSSTAVRWANACQQIRNDELRIRRALTVLNEDPQPEDTAEHERLVDLVRHQIQLELDRQHQPDGLAQRPAGPGRHRRPFKLHLPVRASTVGAWLLVLVVLTVTLVPWGLHLGP